MKEEVNVAARFLIKVVENGCAGSLSQEQLDGLQERLIDLLCARFENHWLVGFTCQSIVLEVVDKFTFRILLIDLEERVWILWIKIDFRF